MEKLEDFKDIQDNLIDVVYKIRENDPIGKIASNAGGWQSNDDSPELEFFLSHIVENFKIFSECVLENYWVNINPKGTFNRVHVHPGCDLSGVLWIKTPKDSGTFEFDSPQLFSQFRVMECYSEEITDRHKLYPSYWIPSEEGKIVFFPASLSHKVNSSQSREDRISVAFNIDVNN